MNERLIELYRSCRPKEALASQDQFKSANVLLGSEVEKFAELIVKECADISLKSGNIANKNIAAKIESERIYHKIKEHFGVEQ